MAGDADGDGFPQGGNLIIVEAEDFLQNLLAVGTQFGAETVYLTRRFR